MGFPACLLISLSPGIVCLDLRFKQNYTLHRKELYPWCLECDYLLRLGGSGCQQVPSADAGWMGPGSPCAVRSVPRGAAVRSVSLCYLCDWLQRNSPAASPVWRKIGFSPPMVLWDGFGDLCHRVISAPLSLWHVEDILKLLFIFCPLSGTLWVTLPRLSPAGSWDCALCL
jgi:hypothetical protein